MTLPLEQRIKAAILACPGRSDYEISRSYRGSNSEMVRGIRMKISGMKPTEIAPTPLKLVGISLLNRNVSARRPAENAAKFIKRLPNGKGFDPKQLSKEWGLSEETIKKHAKEMKCFKFVEITEDEWVPLIVSPETAATYHT